MKKSLVSIILPVYNSSKFLPQCLESLIKQTYSKFEIIAIDDHSKDDSVKILKNFKKKCKKTCPEQDRKIEIFHNKKHYGTAVCYNRALRIAAGQFLAFMNPNDLLSIHKFKRQINYLRANPKTVAIGSQCTSIDENNRRLGKSAFPQNHEEIYQTLLSSPSLKPEALLINRMLFPKDLIQFTINKYPLMFAEVLIKLLQYGKVTNLKQSFYFHRVGIKRLSRQSSKLQQTFSLLQLLLKSRSTYDYRPSFRSLFPPLVKGI